MRETESMYEVRQALLDMDHVVRADSWGAGYSGPQIDVLLEDTDSYDFWLQVEDISINCSWCLVGLRSGRYDRAEFGDRATDDDTLVATVEVDRLPDQ